MKVQEHKHEEIPRWKLDEKHLQKAKEIAGECREKDKSCKLCYDRGYIGVKEDNTLVICPKCTDYDTCVEPWVDYLLEVNDPLLNVFFKQQIDIVTERRKEKELTKE